MRRCFAPLPLILAGFCCFISMASEAAPVGGTLIDSLNFGRMIAGTAGGDLIMDVSTGVRAGTGSVVPLSGGSPTRLRADLTADPGVSVTVSFPASLFLMGTLGGPTVSWTPTLNTSPIFLMPASGTFTLYMGGSLSIPFAALPDDYVGSATISVEYTF